MPPLFGNITASAMCCACVPCPCECVNACTVCKSMNASGTEKSHRRIVFRQSLHIRRNVFDSFFFRLDSFRMKKISTFMHLLIFYLNNFCLFFFPFLPSIFRTNALEFLAVCKWKSMLCATDCRESVWDRASSYRNCIVIVTFHLFTCDFLFTIISYCFISLAICVYACAPFQWTAVVNETSGWNWLLSERENFPNVCARFAMEITARSGIHKLNATARALKIWKSSSRRQEGNRYFD